MLSESIVDCLKTGFQSKFEYDDVMASSNGKIIMGKINGYWFVFNAKGEKIASDLRVMYEPKISQNFIAMQNEEGKWGFLKFE